MSSADCRKAVCPCFEAAYEHLPTKGPRLTETAQGIAAVRQRRFQNEFDAVRLDAASGN